MSDQLHLLARQTDSAPALARLEATQYDLATADGLLNRAHNLYTDGDRVKAYQNGLLDHGDEDWMIITRLTPARLVARVTFRIITLDGILVRVFNAFAHNIAIVLLLVFNTLIITAINGVYFGYAGQMDAATDIFGKLPVQFVIVVAVAVGVELIRSVSKLVYHRTKSYLAIMRRIRFDYIVKQMRELDPNANSHEYEYNSDKDDPDVAIAVLRHSAQDPDSQKKGRYLWPKIKTFFCGQSVLVRRLATKE